MAAYVISEVEILDDRAATEYRERAAASIEKYGGIRVAPTSTCAEVNPSNMGLT